VVLAGSRCAQPIFIQVRLSTTVELELLLSSCDLGYGLTTERKELDFVAR